ncbi:SDR family oxidoreductase [Legionella sainthelensi]|uniref:Oxidoreductase n=2 Tax=Legionella sainthelensi TaxID=28087 RepID=A0A2H5FH71_9GAMM|nr:SDR family oxidoreductase [Legionella sainthelensi]
MTMINSKNEKIVLITGTSTGIGSSLALAFAHAGFQTIATMRNIDKAKTLLDRADKEKLHVDVRQLDVCDDQSIDLCIGEVLNDYGRIDILINNAGEGFHRTLEQASLDDVKKVMDVNFYGVVRLTKAVLPSMRQMQNGHIITISSLGGLIAVPFSEIYCAAKFAVEGMMEALAPIANTLGIHISLIEPGPVTTAFAGKLQQPHASNIPVYEELEQILRVNFPKHFPNGPQTGDEIAQIVLKAALSNKPKLRYVTSADGVNVASHKYVDINNSAYFELGQQLFATHEKELLD